MTEQVAGRKRRPKLARQFWREKLTAIRRRSFSALIYIGNEVATIKTHICSEQDTMVTIFTNKQKYILREVICRL